MKRERNLCDAVHNKAFKEMQTDRNTRNSKAYPGQIEPIRCTWGWRISRQVSPLEGQGCRHCGQVHQDAGGRGSPRALHPPSTDGLRFCYGQPTVFAMFLRIDRAILRVLRASMSRVTARVSRALVAITHRHVRMPWDAEAARAKRRAFFRVAGK